MNRLVEHLTDTDLELLGGFAHRLLPDDQRSNWHGNPDALLLLMAHPELFRALFGADTNDSLLLASPFLLFFVLVCQGRSELGERSFTEEWVGYHRRVPVFAADELSEFMAPVGRRYFIAELLASYTHVSSGVMLIRSGTSVRRSRYSELDPVRMAQLVFLVPDAARHSVLRRLGDLALFLTGVFPDHLGSHPLSEIDLQRILRSLGATRPSEMDMEPPPRSNPIELFQWVGRRSYQLAVEAALRVGAGVSTDVVDLADGFAHARRFLNFLTDRHLCGLRGRWFGIEQA